MSRRNIYLTRSALTRCGDIAERNTKSALRVGISLMPPTASGVGAVAHIAREFFAIQK